MITTILRFPIRGEGRTGEVKHYGYFAAVFESVLVEIFDSNPMLLSRYFLTKIHSKKTENVITQKHDVIFLNVGLIGFLHLFTTVLYLL